MDKFHRSEELDELAADTPSFTHFSLEQFWVNHAPLSFTHFRPKHFWVKVSLFSKRFALR